MAASCLLLVTECGVKINNDTDRFVGTGDQLVALQ